MHDLDLRRQVKSNGGLEDHEQLSDISTTSGVIAIDRVTAVISTVSVRGRRNNPAKYLLDNSWSQASSAPF